MTKPDPKLDALIADTARRYLGIETLETQNTGDDFHEVAVWTVERALKAAFAAGATSAAEHAPGR